MTKYEFNEVQIVNDKATNFEVMKSIVKSEKQEKAFYVLDIGWVAKKHCDWINRMPRVVPHYAVKCNPDLTVIKTLAALNGSFDCASQEEIRQVMAAGVAPERIIFANPAKIFSHIKYARDVGVERMTVDSVQEIEKIRDIFPAAKLVIRIRNDGHSERDYMTSLGEKFGCDPEVEAPMLVEAIKSMGMSLHGFSFHAGSPCPDTSAFVNGIKICKRLIDRATLIGMRDVKMIDLGGGFLGLTDEQLDAAATAINGALEDVDSSIEVISEPGRYYVEGAFTLAALVHSRKELRNGNTVKQIYYVNDGCYGSFIEELLAIHSRVPKPLYEKANDNEKFLSTIWGPTCDSYDCIVKDQLMTRYAIGDWMVWTHMGAYSIALTSEFNGMPTPDVYPFIKEGDMKYLKSVLGKVNNGVIARNGIM